MLTSRMDEKNRVTIPAEVLAALGTGPGKRLTWELDGATIVVSASERSGSAQSSR